LVEFFVLVSSLDKVQGHGPFAKRNNQTTWRTNPYSRFKNMKSFFIFKIGLSIQATWPGCRRNAGWKKKETKIGILIITDRTTGEGVKHQANPFTVHNGQRNKCIIVMNYAKENSITCFNHTKFQIVYGLWR